MTTADRRAALDIKRRDIARRERDERAVLLHEHIKKFETERAALQQECGQLGHVRGSYHDNGLGWEWYYCRHCNARMDIRQYGDQADE